MVVEDGSGLSTEDLTCMEFNKNPTYPVDGGNHLVLWIDQHLHSEDGADGDL